MTEPFTLCLIIGMFFPIVALFGAIYFMLFVPEGFGLGLILLVWWFLWSDDE